MTTFLKKKSKKNQFWGHFGPFLPKFGQKWIFLEKRALAVFRRGKYQTDRQTDRRW